MKKHVLYEKGDKGIPDQILDRNGDVALGLCKVCGKGEIELEGPCVSPLEQIAKSFEDWWIGLFGKKHDYDMVFPDGDFSLNWSFKCKGCGDVVGSTGQALHKTRWGRCKPKSAVEMARRELTYIPSGDFENIDQLTYNACRHFDSVHDVWDHVFSMIDVKHGTKEFNEAKDRCKIMANSYGIY